MKLKIFALCGIALLLVVLPGCTRVNIKTQPEVKYVFFQDAGYEWVVIISQVSYLPNNPPGAIIKIRNTLDRNLTLDFDGTSHYGVSIGDNSEHTLEVKEGYYKIMASAPGLTYIPHDEKCFFMDRWVYNLRWVREKSTTRY
jgi:hypothetical protein